ncbi:hypothetical protein ABZ249_25490 [Nocardiopsis sp. NPDC006139]|uniref:hypothetical protein n=1 Tax=Nocardiopsis sp. NPDC006139 TaxID=3154578 RepID=UPI0033A43D36
MFRALRSALVRLRRPAAPPVPAPSRATPVGELQVFVGADVSEFIDQLDDTARALAAAPDLGPAPLPVRTPGLAGARRHVWDATGHALGAVRAMSAWADDRLDDARSSEADVRHLAALHQIDAALDALAAARTALKGPR